MNLTDLAAVAARLNEEGIRYGLGGSTMLYAYGLVDCPQDIDLVLAPEDAEKGARLLGELGKGVPLPPKPPCCSRFFMHFEIGDSEVDLIAGFRAEHREGFYEWIWKDSHRTGELVLEQGIRIPLTSLEEWLVLYALMGRQGKVELVSQYLLENGRVRTDILHAALEQPLPDDVRQLVKSFL